MAFKLYTSWRRKLQLLSSHPDQSFINTQTHTPKETHTISLGPGPNKETALLNSLVSKSLKFQGHDLVKTHVHSGLPTFSDSSAPYSDWYQRAQPMQVVPPLGWWSRTEQSNADQVRKQQSYMASALAPVSNERASIFLSASDSPSHPAESVPISSGAVPGSPVLTAELSQPYLKECISRTQIKLPWFLVT